MRTPRGGRRQRSLVLLVIPLFLFSGGCGGDSGAEETQVPTVGGTGGWSANAEVVVREFTEAVNENENKRAADLLAEGAVIYGEAVPPGGGETAVAAFQCTVEIESMEQNGDTVTAELRSTGPRESASGACPRTGGDPVATKYTVRDGKIVEIND